MTLRFGVPILLLGWLVVHFWPKSISVQAVGFLNTVANVDGLPVEVYRFDDSGAGAYPPIATSSATIGSGGALRLSPSDLPPAGVYLRVDSPVHGVAFAHVAPHRAHVAFEFGAPRTLAGHVQDTDGKPLAGARVVALPHRYGPALGEASSGAHGEFAIERLSSSASFFALRVLLAGYAVRDIDVQWVEGQAITTTLTRTRPVTGRVEAPAGVALTALAVRAFRCPGISARVHADGGFSLDSFPTPPTNARLLVHGLPPGHTHASVLATAGDHDIVLRVVRAATVRGVVVTADRDLPVPGAYVQHPHGPEAGLGAYTAAGGAFELTGLPAGRVRLDAFGGMRRLIQVPGEPDRMQVPFGFVDIDVEEGETREGVVVRVR